MAGREVSAAQEILFDVADQELVLEVDGEITSITSVAVREMTADDTTAAQEATTDAAAVDTTATATTAAAGAGEDDPQLLTVTSTVGFEAGRRYLIAGGGNWEVFELEGVISATQLWARHPLGNLYATGAAVTGKCRATITVDTSWAGDLTNLSTGAEPNARWRVSWNVRLANPTRAMVVHRNFDLVRIPAEPPVGPIDIDDALPGWLDRLPPDHQKTRGRKLIVEAARQVRMDLWRDGIADHALRDGEVYAELVIAKTVYLTLRLQRLLGAADAGQVDEAAKAYKERRDGLVRTPTLAVDRGGGGGATTKKGRATPLTVR
jgi:hypothetical protein